MTTTFNTTYNSDDKPLTTTDDILSRKSSPYNDEAEIAYNAETQVRGTWAHKTDFLLSALGYVIGFGNIWRFPYLVYLNGGGTFLIPYLVMLVSVGLPMFYMELVLGQYSGASPTQIFERMAPLVSGLGYCMSASTFLITIEYNLMLAYSIYFLFAGFSYELPWTVCGDNRPMCVDNRQRNVSNLECYPNCVYSTDYFYRYNVLGQDPYVPNSWCNYGNIQWHLVFCLLLAWTIIGASLIQGVKSTGKIVYFTATFPFVILVILLFQTITLEGAKDGLSYYLSPDFTKLTKPKVWVQAASQIFYSLSVGYGGLHTLASYNKFDNNCLLDAVIISFSDACVSIMAGFVVFSLVGFMSGKTGRGVHEVVKDGTILTFVTMPDAVSHMPAAHVWSFVFFSMLVTLGMDSVFTFMETLVTSLLDHHQWLRPHRSVVVLISCFMGFVFGIGFCAPQGYELFTLIDSKSASWNLLILLLVEVSTVSFLYGVQTFWENIEDMEMPKSESAKYFWIVCWVCITPTALCILLLWNFYCINNPELCKLDKENNLSPTELPAIAVLGHLLTVTPLIFLPIFACKEICHMTARGDDLAALIHHTQEWIPNRTGPKKKKVTSYLFGSQQIWPPLGVTVPPHWDPDDFRLYSRKRNRSDPPFIEALVHDKEEQNRNVTLLSKNQLPASLNLENAANRLREGKTLVTDLRVDKFGPSLKRQDTKARIVNDSSPHSQSKSSSSLTEDDETPPSSSSSQQSDTSTTSSASSSLVQSSMLDVAALIMSSDSSEF